MAIALLKQQRSEVARAELKRLAGGHAATALYRTVTQLRQRVETPADDELLRHFAHHRDEAAFAELVHRHGAMVQGVARRALGDYHAAEDVLQATFLLLARKARHINWQR